MKTKMYSIYDKAAQAYVTPFFMHTKAMAIRAFESNVNAQDENNISKHPEQFSLFELGEFDDSVAKLELHSEPELVASALELVKPTEETNLIKEIQTLKAILSTQKGE